MCVYITVGDPGYPGPIGERGQKGVRVNKVTSLFLIVDL